MEELSNEVIRKAMQALVEITMCAVCLETVRGKVIQCINGHVICEECGEALDICPSCRCDFSTDAPITFITQVMGALPPQCKYKNCGKFLKNETDDHEKYCGFEPSTCKVSNCEMSVPGNAILEHIIQKHPQNMPDENNSSHTLVIKNYNQDENNVNHIKVYLVQDQFIWHEIKFCAVQNGLIHSFTVVPNGKGKPTHNFYVKLTSSSISNDTKCMFKIKLNLDKDSLTVDDNVICMPKCMLSRIVNVDENLLINISIKTK